MDYKRLTTRIDEMTVAIETRKFDLEAGLTPEAQDWEATKKMVFRLAELEDKLENGTLIELPKKCYQVVWCLGWEIVEYDVVAVEYDYNEGITRVKATHPYSTQYFIKDNHRDFTAFGEYVFFTKAEAEAKLKELQGDRE